MKVCPICGFKPRSIPNSNFLVCSGCSESLYVNDLVEKVTVFTKIEYWKKYDLQFD
jgi:hypothetical protein